MPLRGGRSAPRRGRRVGVAARAARRARRAEGVGGARHPEARAARRARRVRGARDARLRRGGLRGARAASRDAFDARARRTRGVPRDATARDGARAVASPGRRASARHPNAQAAYDLGPVVGRGSTSTVHRSTRKSDNRAFATKVITEARLRGGRFAAIADQFETEILALRRCRHPNIVRLEAAIVEGGRAPAREPSSRCEHPVEVFRRRSRLTRGDAAAATRRFSGSESRRRRGGDAEV